MAREKRGHTHVGRAKDALGAEFDQRVVLEALVFVLLLSEQLVARVDEDERKDTQRAFETLEHGRTGQHEHAAQYGGTHDAVLERDLLSGRRHLEVREHQYEHEQVVHRQRLLEDVAREELGGGVSALDGEYARAEERRATNPQEQLSRLRAIGGVGFGGACRQLLDVGIVACASAHTGTATHTRRCRRRQRG